MSALYEALIAEPHRAEEKCGNDHHAEHAPECHLPLYDSQGLAESHLDVLGPPGDSKIGLARQ